MLASSIYLEIYGARLARQNEEGVSKMTLNKERKSLNLVSCNQYGVHDSLKLRKGLQRKERQLWIVVYAVPVRTQVLWYVTYCCGKYAGMFQGYLVVGT